MHNACMHVVSTTVSASGPSATLLCLVAIVGCTAADRKAAENERINQQAATEVARICVLPAAEREAELKKLKEQSGMQVYCPKD
jgi:hypothetical protein